MPTPTCHPCLLAGLAAGLVVLAAGPALAQSSLTVPQGYGTSVGNSSNSYPWARGSADTRFQQIYDASLFTGQGVQQPVLIQALRFRPFPGVAATWSGGSWSNLRIDVATCPNDFLLADAVFANNLGPDRTTVHSGSFSIAPGALTAAGGVEPSHVVVPFAVPFRYDPAQGDLVFDVLIDGSTWSGGTVRACDVVSGATAQPLGTRVYSTAGATAVSGTIGLQHALVCEVDYVPAAGLYPSFRANVTAGISPLTVVFSDTSYSSDPQGVLSWAWDFDGDAVVDSTVANPTHVYPACGVYSVTLTVGDASHGSRTTTRTDYIAVDATQADFVYAQTSLGQLQFTDTSTPAATSWAWDFDGDSVVDSTLQNPTHQFADACSAVLVTLNARRNCGPVSSRSRPVSVSPRQLLADTTGGSGTSGAVVVGNVFDAEVLAPQGVTICSLEVRPFGFVGPYRVYLYVSDGSHLDLLGGLPRHEVPDAWRLVGIGVGDSPGGNNLTSALSLATLGQPVHLPRGRYALAVLLANPSGTAFVAYSVAAAATQGPFADPNLVLNPQPAVAPGVAKYNLFGSGSIDARVWNGALHYTTVGDDGRGRFGFAALGCRGTQATSQLTATGNPMFGSTLTLAASNLPVGAMVMITGLGRYAPTPLDLGAFGAPGCAVHAAIDASVFQAAPTWNLAIPSATAFAGLVLFHQALVLDPQANTLGVVVSDASGLVVGS